MTNFDFVLLLIVSEATQNAMIGDDFSLTNGILVILTLVGVDIGLSLIKERFLGSNVIWTGCPWSLSTTGAP
jgi:uncharacterized membrane protein YcaP (DUF421 family)